MSTEQVILDDDQRMKVLMMFLGTLDSMHTHLNEVKDRFEVPGESALTRNPLDHNVEQAQIAVENAHMRLQQAMIVVEERMGEKQ